MTDLHHRAQIIKEAINQLKEICGEEDSELLADMVEGETSIDRFAEISIEQIENDAGMIEALKLRIADMTARKQRFEQRQKSTRQLVAWLMSEAGMKKLELPVATLSLRNIQPSVKVVDEALVPSRYWVQRDPVIDLKNLRRDVLAYEKERGAIMEMPDPDERAEKLKALDFIEGVQVGNADLSLTVRTK